MPNRKSTCRFRSFKGSNILFPSAGSSVFSTQLFNQISIQTFGCPDLWNARCFFKNTNLTRLGVAPLIVGKSLTEKSSFAGPVMRTRQKANEAGWKPRVAHSPGQAKRHPGYCMYMLSSAPWKGKSINPYVDFAQWLCHIYYAFALSER